MKIIEGSEEWLLEEEEFTINEQSASISCIGCGKPLELYNYISTSCDCGRLYRMQTAVVVEWVEGEEIVQEKWEYE